MIKSWHGLKPTPAFAIPPPMGVGSRVTVESLLTFLNYRRVIHFSFFFTWKLMQSVTGIYSWRLPSAAPDGIITFNQNVVFKENTKQCSLIGLMKRCVSSNGYLIWISYQSSSSPSSVGNNRPSLNPTLSSRLKVGNLMLNSSVNSHVASAGGSPSQWTRTWVVALWFFSW
jgi:hypothetical protein